MHRLRRSIVVLAVALAAAGPAFAQTDQASAYRVGPKDVLDVKVLQLPDLNVTRRVSDAGTIDLPILGEVPVAGLTVPEVQKRIAGLLTAKYVNRADVSVVISEYNATPISVLGAVQKPGILPYSGEWSLIQALTAVGGLSSNAGRRIYVLRRADNGLSDTLTINVSDLLKGDPGMWNIPIYPSDVVNVPPSTNVTVFCIGEVKTPGALTFDSDDPLTVLSVIAKAGGFTERASHTVTIKRKAPDGKDIELEVNVNRVIAGKSPDVPIHPDDVVIVKESFF